MNFNKFMLKCEWKKSFEGNQIHNFMSSSGSGTVINYGSGSGSDFLTSYGSGYGSGSTSQKVTVPTVPVPVPVPHHWREPWFPPPPAPLLTPSSNFCGVQYSLLGTSYYRRDTQYSRPDFYRKYIAHQPQVCLRIRVVDSVWLSRIPDPDFYPSRIPDPKTATKERSDKN